MRLVDSGYAFTSVDVRGRGDSDGVWCPWVNDGTDGAEVIEWAAAQKWSTGDVATIGGSYDAITQWWAAVHRPAHLRCMIAISVSPLHEMSGPLGRSNGVVMPYWLWWLHLLQDPSPERAVIDWDDVLNAPPAEMALRAGVPDGPWQQYLAGQIGYGEQSWAIDPLDVEVPVLVTNGLWDDPKTFELWQALAGSTRTADHRLIVGAWDHAGNGAPRPILGSVDVSAAITDPVPHWIAFLDHWMRGGPAPSETALVARSGSWEWERHEQWPPPGTTSSTFELAGGGWEHDPSAPIVQPRDGPDLAWADAPLDPAWLENRGDVWTGDLPVATEPQHLSGAPEVRLIASQPQPGTLVCWLTDVAPDGTRLQLGLWPTAAAHPGGSAAVSFGLAAINHALKPGHHVRIGLASSFAPIYAHALVPYSVTVTDVQLDLPRSPTS